MMRKASDPATKTLSPVKFYVLPAALGLSGGLLSCFQSGFSLISIVMALVLLIAGLITGWSLFGEQTSGLKDVNQAWREDEKRKLDDIDAYAMELERMFLQVVPILLRQVQTSRSHTEQEITTLTGRFAAMVNHLEQLIASTLHSEQGRSVDGLFNDTRDALTTVLHVLSEIQKVEHTVVEQIRNLSAHTQQLDAMAKEVRKVAEQINLLALNAAIEAARAGENGRGFAVVADEVRKLASSSSSTGERISKAIQDINTAMAATLALSEVSGTNDDKSIRDAEESIRLALGDLRKTMNMFKDDADMLRGHSSQIRDEIYSVLTAFQFQDRVSQMLSHVEHNLDSLQVAVNLAQASGERHANSIDVSRTLSRMELSYTMPEELINHSASGARVAAQSDDLTFF